MSEEKKTVKYVYELKTTSEEISVGSIYWKKLSLDGQVSGYMAAEPDADGCLYDVIRKTALRPTGKGSETEDSYTKRIVNDIADDPDRYFQRGIITRTEQELVEYEQDMVGTAAMIQWARKHNVWPRQVSSCTNWNRVCEFFATCSDGRPVEEYTTVRPDMNRGRGLPVLSASARSTYALCPRKFQFAYDQRRRVTSEEAPALYFGKAMHTAIQAYWNPKAGFGNDGLERALYRVEKMTPGHERAHAKALVLGYHVKYENTGFRLVDVEREFVRPLKDPETGAESKFWSLGGFIDGIAEFDQ